MNKQYEVSKPVDFKEVIEDVLSWYKKSDQDSLIISLQGDLGAGKTTFTQELGRALGVGEEITSPTFTIMKQYEIDHEDFEQMVHIDAYRIESDDEAGPLHLDSIFSQPKTVVCVEWPEKIKSIIPQHAAEIKISIEENEVRQVSLSTN